MTTSETITSTVRLPVGLHEAATRRADQLDRSLNWFIADAVRYMLDVYENADGACNWGISDESGSCGFSYETTIVFNIPAMEGCDKHASTLVDRLRAQLARADARDIITSMHGIRPMDARAFEQD